MLGRGIVRNCVVVLGIGVAVWGLWDLTPEERSHVYSRFIIHIFCGAGALLIFQTLFCWIAERLLKLSPLPGWWFFIVPGLAAVFAIGLREPWDVASGNPWVKSYFDYASWLLGIAAATWGRWRMNERMAIVWDEIKEGRGRRGIK